MRRPGASPRIAVTALAALSALGTARARAAEPVAPGVELIRGGFTPGSQPDGNTVVFRGPDGLVVLDTGRHEEHTKKVLDAAAAAKLPVKAVLNSHWHLDHIAGNPAVKKAHPGAKVYASSAIDEALKGFLASYRKQLIEMIEKTPDEEKRKPWRAEIARIDAGRALAPDEVVTAAGTRRLAGMELEIGLERRAVTAGDVWVFDPKTRVLAAGDLVTLPVPFLDTACPDGWKDALTRLAKKDFTTLVPGHGAPMDRAAFETYRAAFEKLLACAAGTAANDACVNGWMNDAAPLLKAEDPKLARMLADYYVGGVLRGDASAIAKRCGQQAGGAPR